jgi:hypothetical protein
VLSKADDFPVHQRAEPIATAGTDRNFYDRYFFYAQSPDGGCFLAAALGVYPHLDVMDAAFSWMEGGVQRSVFASRRLRGERMDTSVGPISVEVLEPLHRLRVQLLETDGLAAELLFDGRHAPIEEPRFTWRLGPRTIMDATRMTQNVLASGTVRVGSEEHAVSRWTGTRDRSWGVRPVGAPDSQPPAAAPQFFWLWAPLNFDRYCLYAHTNDDADGAGWNRSARLVDLETATEQRLIAPRFHIDWKPGTRRAAAARLDATTETGEALEVRMAPEAAFQMHGLGYGHPRFAHGAWRGELDVASESFDSSRADPATPLNAHVQALVHAEMRIGDSNPISGRGVLEQLIIGPHRPSGFRDVFDLA